MHLPYNSLQSNGMYQVTVTLNSYSNPGNMCKFCRANTGGHCDSDRSGCDNIFFYCLLDINSTDEDCPQLGRLTSSENRNGIQINFTSPIVLGLPNPFTLSGLSLLKVSYFN